jgi:hypothetical protein
MSCEVNFRKFDVLYTGIVRLRIGIEVVNAILMLKVGVYLRGYSLCNIYRIEIEPPNL